MVASTGMMLDGVLASSAIDSSGEILEIEGADISDFEEGKGVVNYEHADSERAGASPNDIVGRIVFAKKIFSAKDCDNERQLKYWKDLELPFIYGVVRLYDGAGHLGAQAAAAMIRDHVANGEPILARWSIEGSTLKREGQRLIHTVCRKVALTLRPCNRTCDTGLLEDPNAPKGFEFKGTKEEKDLLADLADAKKSERAPDALILGAHIQEYTPFPEDLGKALTAGSYNAAPGSLTGGAALQVEDEGLRRRHLINQAKAAVRDYKKSDGDFKTFLKFRLPEADESFIDRFANMVDEYRLKKKDILGDTPKAPKEPLTIRGKVAKVPNVDGPVFDENKGVLHTPRGSFPMYIPGRDKQPGASQAFHNIMADPVANKIHGYAFRHWKKAHTLLKAGRLPPAVVMHAALFSMLSPNTPVPVQELMYGHLVDAMRASGIDARSSKFRGLKRDWKGRSHPDQYPVHSPEHWRRLDDELRIAKDSKDTGRKAGDISSFMLANDKFSNMANYHRMHDYMLDLIARHGTDGRAAVAEMMDAKRQAKNWENRRKNAEKAGRPDPGPFEGQEIRGLAPKTARYMYGMMGGGNVAVPDTHFIRYLFGLDRGLDGHTIDYLKDNVLWNENNHPVLDAIDRYYIQHHDAVKHMAMHPLARGMSPEDLAFPAFWRNWMAIVPHEKLRGMTSNGFNEGTDHRPYWEAIADDLDQPQEKRVVLKAEPQDAWAQAVDSAKQHLMWQEMLGEGPAMILYLTKLLPAMLPDEDASLNPEAPLEVPSEPNGTVAKFEAVAAKLAVFTEVLRKAVDEPAKKTKRAEAPGIVTWQGNRVKPGVLHFFHESPGDAPSFAILGHDDKHFHVVAAKDGEGTIDAVEPGAVKKLSRLPKDSVYAVRRWPEMVGSGKVVDAELHGDANFNTDAGQKKLIHGLDFGAEPLQNQSKYAGAQSHESHWRRHPDKRNIYLKGSEWPTDFTAPRREVAFHNLARDVFGLGHLLTPTALVKHPQTGQEFAAIEKVKGVHYDRAQHGKDLHSLGESGELDKAAMMDWVLGVDDRHVANWMMAGGKGGHQLKLIDHGHAFTDRPQAYVDVPSYLVRHHEGMGAWSGNMDDQLVHPEARQWIQDVNPVKLVVAMKKMGVPPEYISAAHKRLQYLQTIAKPGAPLRLGDVFDPNLSSEEDQPLSRLMPV